MRRVTDRLAARPRGRPELRRMKGKEIMTMPKFAGVVAAALAVFALAWAAAQQDDPMMMTAGRKPMGMGPMQMGMMGHCPQMSMMMGTSPAAWILSMQDKLNLDEKQADKLAEMDAQFRIKQVDRRAALEKKMIQLQQAIKNEQSTEQIKSMLDEVSKGYVDMVMAWLDGKEKAKEVLTAEQRAMLKSTRGGMMMGKAPMAPEKPRSAM